MWRYLCYEDDSCAEGGIDSGSGVGSHTVGRVVLVVLEGMEVLVVMMVVVEVVVVAAGLVVIVLMAAVDT